MIIDCDDCAMRDLACGDCVVTVLLGSAPAQDAPVEFDVTEQRAMASLAGAGLIPPLRMVPLTTPRFRGSARPTGMTESA
ncbi:MAG: hypothetical protein H0T85_03530 [Geodermatophilaceae bacterium]|nr:hypothetical protein [Geodermatophilaceae bacterium]